MPSRIYQNRFWSLSAFVNSKPACSLRQLPGKLQGGAWSPAVEPLENEPPAKIVIDRPLADSLSLGRVVIQYRAERICRIP